MKKFIIKIKIFISDAKFYIVWSYWCLEEEKDLLEKMYLLFFKYLNPFYMIKFTRDNHAALNRAIITVMGTDFLKKEITCQK
jgi:hypothetical protein